MNWFTIALLAPALWSISNHIDKYLVSKYFKGGGTGSLLIFSSFIGLIVLPIIYIIQPHVFSISFLGAAFLVLNGFLYIVGILPYFYALQKDEASIVVPLFQTIPVFSYLLSFLFLGETLTSMQLFAGSLVIAGAVTLSLDITEKKPRFKKEVFGLMFLSSFLVALNSLIFKYFSIQSDFWTTSFWEYIGFVIFAVVLFVGFTSYRKQFLKVLRTNKLRVLSINVVNELVNIIAKCAMNFASLLAPLALVWVVNGFQPFFVLLYGVILTTFFPHLGTENLGKKHLAQKIIAISIMFLGTYLLQ